MPARILDANEVRKGHRKDEINLDYEYNQRNAIGLKGAPVSAHLVDILSPTDPQPQNISPDNIQLSVANDTEGGISFRDFVRFLEDSGIYVDKNFANTESRTIIINKDYYINLMASYIAFQNTIDPNSPSALTNAEKYPNWKNDNQYIRKNSLLAEVSRINRMISGVNVELPSGLDEHEEMRYLEDSKEKLQDEKQQQLEQLQSQVTELQQRLKAPTVEPDGELQKNISFIYATPDCAVKKAAGSNIITLSVNFKNPADKDFINQLKNMGVDYRKKGNQITCNLNLEQYNELSAYVRTQRGYIDARNEQERIRNSDVESRPIYQKRIEQLRGDVDFGDSIGSSARFLEWRIGNLNTKIRTLTKEIEGKPYSSDHPAFTLLQKHYEQLEKTETLMRMMEVLEKTQDAIVEQISRITGVDKKDIKYSMASLTEENNLDTLFIVNYAGNENHDSFRAIGPKTTPDGSRVEEIKIPNGELIPFLNELKAKQRYSTRKSRDSTQSASAELFPQQQTLIFSRSDSRGSRDNQASAKETPGTSPAPSPPSDSPPADRRPGKPPENRKPGGKFH